MLKLAAFTSNLNLTPTPYPYSLVRSQRRRGRSVSESPPVSCLFISCKTPAAALRSAAETKNSGARRVAQDEGFGWQRCAASADLGGAAAAGVLQEGWRQETGAKGGASRLPLTFCLLPISRLYLGVSPDPSLQSLPPKPYSLLPTPYTYFHRCARHTHGLKTQPHVSYARTSFVSRSDAQLSASRNV